MFRPHGAQVTLISLQADQFIDPVKRLHYQTAAAQLPIYLNQYGNKFSWL